MTLKDLLTGGGGRVKNVGGVKSVGGANALREKGGKGVALTNLKPRKNNGVSDAGGANALRLQRKNEMTLKDLKIGESGRVTGVGGEKVLRRRLLDMGITPGTAITVKKAAPLGDPIELLLRGYVLSLRLDDAEKITVDWATGL